MKKLTTVLLTFLLILSTTPTVLAAFAPLGASPSSNRTSLPDSGSLDSASAESPEHYSSIMNEESSHVSDDETTTSKASHSSSQDANLDHENVAGSNKKDDGGEKSTTTRLEIPSDNSSTPEDNLSDSDVTPIDKASVSKNDAQSTKDTAAGNSLDNSSSIQDDYESTNSGTPKKGTGSSIDATSKVGNASDNSATSKAGNALKKDSASRVGETSDQSTSKADNTLEKDSASKAGETSDKSTSTAVKTSEKDSASKAGNASDQSTAKAGSTSEKDSASKAGNASDSTKITPSDVLKKAAQNEDVSKKGHALQRSRLDQLIEKKGFLTKVSYLFVEFGKWLEEIVNDVL